MVIGPERVKALRPASVVESMANMSQMKESGLLGGRVRLRQPATGYRAGMDAALLAAAVGAAAGERVIEAGCGAGGALMQVAARGPGVGLVGLERDAAMVGRRGGS